MFKKIISIAMVCTMLASFVPNVTALENAVVQKRGEERRQLRSVRRKAGGTGLARRGKALPF